jgi:hypothetical protein
MKEKQRASARRGEAKAGKSNACRHCGSRQVVPVVYGLLTPELKAAVKQGKAVVGDREEWEGFTEWHCRECGCEWSGAWIKFKRPR